MKLVGITGAIGHGKSTLIELLKKQNNSICTFESSLLISEVANELNKYFPENCNKHNVDSINEWLSYLKTALFKATHVNSPTVELSTKIDKQDPDYIKLFQYIDLVNKNPSIINQKINPNNKEIYRPLLQWIGGYAVTKIKDTIWYDELIRRAKAEEKNGCKLSIIGGLRFKSDATAIRLNGGKVIRIIRPVSLTDTSDTTERESNEIEADSIVMNDSNLDDLELKAKQIYKDIISNNLKPEY